MVESPGSVSTTKYVYQLKTKPNQPTRFHVDVSGGNYFYFRVKRGFDFVVAITILVLTSPILILIAVLVKLSSEGPAFYTQKRIGSRVTYDGSDVFWELFPFMIFKFRTMHQNAKPKMHREFVKAFIHEDYETMQAIKKQSSDANENQFKIESDPRVTKIGKFLRKTSLDELPQLINVIRGEMSLIGPRPPLPYEVEEYKEKHFKRFAAYQGITGYWQVKGRSAVSFERMVELDTWYAKHQSLWLDIKILIMTPLSVIRGDGAK